MQIVIGVSILVLLMTIWCVFRMIHYLSRPLELAVSIADRIAEGGIVAEGHFNLQLDVGNLIRSLGRMYRNLKSAQSEAHVHRKGLEEKIDQLADSQTSLAEAQHLAQMGNWYWDRAGGGGATGRTKCTGCWDSHRENTHPAGAIFSGWLMQRNRHRYGRSSGR